MPKINFEMPAPLSADQAFAKIQTFMNSDNHFKRLDPKVAATFDQSNKSCQISGSQFKADLKVKPQNDKCSVAIEVDIPFALALFKGKIKEEIEKAFKKVLT
jgi:hypothetical protein